MEDTLVNDAAKSAVLVSSKPGCFIAGADIAWLDSAKDKEEVSIYGYVVEEICYFSLSSFVKSLPMVKL